MRFLIFCEMIPFLAPVIDNLLASFALDAHVQHLGRAEWLCIRGTEKSALPIPHFAVRSVFSHHVYFLSARSLGLQGWAHGLGITLWFSFHLATMT